MLRGSIWINFGLIKYWFYYVREKTSNFHDLWIFEPLGNPYLWIWIHQKYFKHIRQVWTHFWKLCFCKLKTPNISFLSCVSHFWIVGISDFQILKSSCFHFGNIWNLEIWKFRSLEIRILIIWKLEILDILQIEILK